MAEIIKGSLVEKRVVEEIRKAAEKAVQIDLEKLDTPIYFVNLTSNPIFFNINGEVDFLDFASYIAVDLEYAKKLLKELEPFIASGSVVVYGKTDFESERSKLESMIKELTPLALRDPKEVPFDEIQIPENTALKVLREQLEEISRKTAVEGMKKSLEEEGTKVW